MKSDYFCINTKERPMAKVTIDERHNLERALRSFKRQCKQEGILRECKERRHYTKPSVKRRASAMKRKKQSGIQEHRKKVSK